MSQDLKGEESGTGKENYYFRLEEGGGSIYTEKQARSEWLGSQVEMGLWLREITWQFSLWGGKPLKGFWDKE